MLVTEIADRYLTGQITTEESQAAAAKVAQLFQPNLVRLAEWHKQRNDSRTFTKESNMIIQAATGNKATGINYALLHDAVNWAATGRKTKHLRQELGIKGTPRDHMDALQLSMVSYVEGMGAQKVGEKRRMQELPVSPDEAVKEVGKLAYTAHQFTRSTGGHDLQLLMHKPPTMEQLRKALEAPAPTKTQQAVIQKAEMKPAAALPAPPQDTRTMKDFFRPIPKAVPDSALDLYD